MNKERGGGFFKEMTAPKAAALFVVALIAVGVSASIITKALAMA